MMKGFRTAFVSEAAANQEYIFMLIRQLCGIFAALIKQTLEEEDVGAFAP